MPTHRPAESPPSLASHSRRLFFALWPDESVAAALSHWADQVQAERGGHLLGADSLHLTLAFLGPVPVDDIPALSRLLDAPARTGGTLVLDRLGYFRGPRIVWAGPSRRLSWLEALHEALWQDLSRLGRARPNERFCPHVSLLRNAPSGALPAPASPSAIHWEARRLVLAASTGQPAGPGPRYEPLATCRL